MPEVVLCLLEGRLPPLQVSASTRWGYDTAGAGFLANEAGTSQLGQDGKRPRGTGGINSCTLGQNFDANRTAQCPRTAFLSSAVIIVSVPIGATLLLPQVPVRQDQTDYEHSQTWYILCLTM